MSFPRYPKYKDSGVEWLGEVPEHWDVKPLKRCFTIVGGSTPASGDESLWDGDIPWATPSDLSALESLYVETTQRTITTSGLQSCGTTLVPAGTVILSTRAPIGSLGIAATELCTNQGCKSLVPHPTADPKYFGYLLSVSTDQLVVRGKGTTFLELSGSELGSFVVPVPDTNTQRLIASFLDRETAKIDVLIAEQQRLIELLQEKRQAVISHAVTKGLNPDAPMKDSGIEWLGEVPEHWRVMTVRRLLGRVEQGWSPECFAHPAEIDEWGVVKAGCVNRGVFNETDNKALPGSLAPLPQYEIQVGDLLMSRASGSPELVGSTAYVEQVRPRLMLSDKIFRLHPTPIVTRRYFALLFNAPIMRLQIERAISGADGLANNLPQSALRSFFCVAPPVEEQHAIVSHVSSQLAEFSQLSNEAERAIILLQERRSALISAAVTGQIDVRGLAGSEAA